MLFLREQDGVLERELKRELMFVEQTGVTVTTSMGYNDPLGRLTSKSYSDNTTPSGGPMKSVADPEQLVTAMCLPPRNGTGSPNKPKATS